ncbi:hypothetical protein MauCBS54593_002164 [Microsporum audouinii]
MSSGSASTAGSFSEVIKIELRRLYHNECFVCRATPTQSCHILDKGNQFMEPLLRSRGLLNLSLSSIGNAIALCPLCHVNFDNYPDPSLAIIPTDLDYFITFEQEDYSRRVQAANEGVKIPRHSPTSYDYLTHQISTAAVSTDSAGGLYRPIFLREYAPWVSQCNQEKPWHGDPILMICRGISATGTMRIDRFPNSLYTKLRVLQDLYSRCDPPVLPVSMTNRIQPGGDVSGSSADSAGPQPDSASPTLPCDDNENKTTSTWVLGPKSTSNDAVTRFSQVFVKYDSKY